jgi:hypothetical protein
MAMPKIVCPLVGFAKLGFSIIKPHLPKIRRVVLVFLFKGASSLLGLPAALVLLLSFAYAVLSRATVYCCGDEEPESKRKRVEEAPQPEANGEERSAIARRVEPLFGSGDEAAGPYLPARESSYREVPELVNWCREVAGVERHPLLEAIPLYLPDLYAHVYFEGAAFVNPLLFGEPWSVPAPNKYDGFKQIFVNGALFCDHWPYTYFLLDLDPELFVEGPSGPLSLELTAESAARLYVAFSALVPELTRFKADFANWFGTVPYVPRDTESGGANLRNDWVPWADGCFQTAADVMFLEYPKVAFFYTLLREFRSLDLTVVDAYMLNNNNSLQADLFTIRTRRNTPLCACRDQVFPAMLGYLSNLLSGMPAFGIASACRGQVIPPCIVRKFIDEVLTADMRAHLRTGLGPL